MRIRHDRRPGLHLARERLAAEGVVYPGRGRQPLWPILAVTGQPALLGEPLPQISYWANLVGDVRAAGDQRVVLSSEFFAEADDDAASRVVGDLVPVEAAAQAALGAFIAGGAGGLSIEELVRDLDARSLAKVLAKRCRQRMLRAMPR